MLSQKVYSASLGVSLCRRLHGLSRTSCISSNKLSLCSLSSLSDPRARLRPLQTSRQNVQALDEYLIHKERSLRSFCTKVKKSETELSEVSCEDVSQRQTVHDVLNVLSNSHENMKYANTSEFVGETVENEDEEVDKRALIELEVELLRQEGFHVPEVITPLQWEEVFSKTSRASRKSYLKFLFKNEKKKENDKKKKELKRLEREKQRELSDRPSNRFISEDGHIQYGLWCNNLFLRIGDHTMNQYHHCRLMSALMYGQQLVIDVGFDEHMTNKETKGCAKQIMECFAYNRTHPDPFFLHLCNAHEKDGTMRSLERFIPTLHNPEFPMLVHSDSYLDNFPKENLIYLTPHCKEEMTHFDHNATYIIGGIVDLADSEPLTLAKAKKQGIRMQKFPLDRYLYWGLGGKSLTLNQTLAILLDLKHTGNWEHSLRHVPRRKLKKFEDAKAQLQNMYKKKRSDVPNWRRGRGLYDN